MDSDTRVAQLEAALDSIRNDARSASMILVGHPAQPMVDRVVATAESALAPSAEAVVESTPEG